MKNGVATLWLLKNTLGREESVAAYPFLIGQYSHVPLVVGLSWCCHPPKNQCHVAVDPAQKKQRDDVLYNDTEKLRY